MADFSPIVRQAYQEILNRLPDPFGANHWNTLMQGGMTEASMREGLIRSPEYASNHPSGGGGGVHAEMLLHREGTRFALPSGTLIDVRGAISCCFTEEGEANPEWPLASAAFRERVKTLGNVNFLHIRLGPWRAESDSDQWVKDLGGAYLEVPGGRVDLTKWNDLFWNKVDTLISTAGDAGQWVEVDVCDGWGIKHAKQGDFGPNWVYMPWLSVNNIQGQDNISHAGEVVNAIHEAYIRKVVQVCGRHGNVIFQLGNENNLIPSFSPEWERRMANIIHDEEGRKGYLRHLIGTQSQLPSLISDPVIDYSEWHTAGGGVQVAGGKPTGVNEYNPEPPLSGGTVFGQFCASRSNGVAYWLWRHTMSKSSWENALTLVKGGCGVGPVCPLPDFDAPGWVEILPRPGSQTVAALAASEARVTASSPLFIPGSSCLKEVTHENLIAALDAIALDMRLHGTCAWQHSDAVMSLRPDGRWEELHAIAFGSGCLLSPSNAYKHCWKEPS